MVQTYPPEAMPRYPTFQETRPRHESLPNDQYPPENFRYQEFSQGRFSNAPFQGSQDAELASKQFMQQLREKLRSCYNLSSAPKDVLCIGMNDGNITIAVGNGRVLSEEEVRRMFSVLDYRRLIHGLGSAPDDSDGFDDEAYARSFDPRNRGLSQRRNSSFDWRSGESQGRKRQRAVQIDGGEEATVVSKLEGIEIQDSEAVWAAYAQGFKNCQQTLCKLIAKAWVKAVEPKKQTAHPYTKNDEGAPDWWPKPWGPTKDEKVRHKEPDHLYKRERVHLLCHILRLVVQPHSQQHPDIRKTMLNVAKLKETTFETLTSFFAESETNSQKRKYLTNIFKIAWQEERYKRGDIDGATRVFPLKDDKSQETPVSDNDDGSIIRDEEGCDYPLTRSNTAHSMVPSPGSKPSPVSALQSHPHLLGDLPMRSQFPPPSMTESSAQPAQPFLDVTSLSVPGQSQVGGDPADMAMEMAAGHRDIGRRPSGYSEYASPGSGSIYSQQWSMPSSPPNHAALYSYAPQPPNPQTSSFEGPAAPLGPGQPFIQSTFEGSGRASYGQSSNSMLRTVDMSAPIPHQQQQQQAYRYMEN